MYNNEIQQSFNDVVPAVQLDREVEHTLNNQVATLLENRIGGSMQSRYDSSALVEQGILGNVIIGNNQKDGKPLVLAEAGAKTPTEIPKDFPITKLPDGPRPKPERLIPSPGVSIGEGSTWVRPKQTI